MDNSESRMVVQGLVSIVFVVRLLQNMVTYIFGQKFTGSCGGMDGYNMAT